jgi:hypothetical protein
VRHGAERAPKRAHAFARREGIQLTRRGIGRIELRPAQILAPVVGPLELVDGDAPRDGEYPG